MNNTKPLMLVMIEVINNFGAWEWYDVVRNVTPLEALENCLKNINYVPEGTNKKGGLHMEEYRLEMEHDETIAYNKNNEELARSYNILVN